MRLAEAGDTIVLVSRQDRRRFVRTLEAGRTLQTHRGIVRHDDLIGQPLGSEIRTHLGFRYYLLSPTTDELITNLIRKSQIVYPKDAGYIMMKLGVQPGSLVVEAGTGSGGLCIGLATFVGDAGHVYSYDIRADMQELARQNLRRVRLAERVTLKVRDAEAGFDEQDVDAVFLDVLTPHTLLNQARAALRGGGMLGCLVPTANQVIELLRILNTHPGYVFVEVEELMLRSYKTVSDRLRPEDEMVGHTGYLIFARAVATSAMRDTEQQTPDVPIAPDDEED